MPVLRAFALPAVLLFALLLVAAPVGRAQSLGGGVIRLGSGRADSARGVPAPYEVLSRSLALGDAADDDIKAAVELGDLTALTTEIETAKSRQTELEAQVTDADRRGASPRPEALATLHDLALNDNRRLDGTLGRIAGRLDRLTALRTDWTARRRFWRSWRDSLRSDPLFGQLAPEFTAAINRTDRVLARIAAVVPPLLEQQRKLTKLQRTNLALIRQTDALREAQRAALFERRLPVLLSTGFWDRFTATTIPAESWRVGLNGSFLRRHLGLFAVEILLALGLAEACRRLRRRARRDPGVAHTWLGLLRHPAAVGVFLSLSMTRAGFEPTPPVWNLLIWLALSGSVGLVAATMLPMRGSRRWLGLLLGLYPALLVIDLLPLPTPVGRLAVTGLAAVGLIVGWRLVATEFRRSAWALAGFSGIVLVAEIAGFDDLARWLIGAAVLTALAVFTTAFLVLLIRGAIQTVVTTEPSGKLRFHRRVGRALARRLSRLVQILLVIGTALYILTVWQIVPSSVETWNAVVGSGITVGTTQITVGNVLLAGLVLYLAFFLSWTARAFLEGEVLDRWALESGVSDSALTLMHYAFIFVGVLMAFGALGFGLQNFVLILGALGVGIGFGLQNIVNNFVSGLILLFERPVRVGDTVVIGGEWGSVRKIGLRSTTVQTFDQSELIVPNGTLISDKVTNWTLSNSVARLIVKVGVAYGSDVPLAFRELIAATEGMPDILETPEPMTVFSGFGDSSLNLELRVFVRSIDIRLNVQTALHLEIDRRFRAAGISIPFPQRDLHMVSGGVGEPPNTEAKPATAAQAKPD